MSDGKKSNGVGTESANVEAVTKDPVVLVDVANVAYGRHEHGGVPRLDCILAILAELEKTRSNVIAVSDATLRHTIDRKEDFETLVRERKIRQVPAGTSADDLIWTMALHYRGQERQVHILTNDKFPAERARSEAITPFSKIAFMFIEEEVFFQPRLRSILDQSVGLGTLARPGQSPEPESGAETGPSTNTELEGHASSRGPDFTNDTVDDLGEDQQKIGADAEKGLFRADGVPEELIGRLRQFFRMRALPTSGSRSVNFATIASELHTSYSGNFCKRFGFRRPKDLALALEACGYAMLSYKTNTLFIEPTEKLVGPTLLSSPKIDISEE